MAKIKKKKTVPEEVELAEPSSNDVNNSAPPAVTDHPALEDRRNEKNELFRITETPRPVYIMRTFQEEDFHFFTTSSREKSSLLKIAASVWSKSPETTGVTSSVLL